MVYGGYPLPPACKLELHSYLQRVPGQYRQPGMMDAPYHQSSEDLPSWCRVEIKVDFGDKKVHHGRCVQIGGERGVVVRDHVV